MDFPRLFLNYGIDFTDRVSPGWVNVRCPLCPDHSQNGGFNLAGEYYHCWRCGGHHLDIILSRLLQVPKSQVAELTRPFIGRTALIDRLNGRKVAKAKQLELPGGPFSQMESHYLSSRRYDPDYLRDKYGFTGGGIAGDWRYRIVIPLTVGGRLVSWTARSILSPDMLKKTGQPRYKNLGIEESVMDPKKILYNLDNCRNRMACLLEGPFDVVRMGDGFLCSFGTSMTQAQIAELKRRFDRVLILFDAEPEAQAKARKYGSQMAALGLLVELVDAFGDFQRKDRGRVMACSDAGELSPKQSQKLRDQLGF